MYKTLDHAKTAAAMEALETKRRVYVGRFQGLYYILTGLPIWFEYVDHFEGNNHDN